VADFAIVLRPANGIKLPRHTIRGRMNLPDAPAATRVNSPAQVLFASLIGTAIEFFDFYIYATAAVLVFPRLFFPASDETAARLASLATFAIAFFARPIGSALFGHFGDRVGRKTTLVAALLTMGLSTVIIGVLPTYASIGVLAPLLLALCRFGQGLGLGGEWGGAVLLAIENAPPGRRAWYGMFPQLGAPAGFVCSAGIFLLLSAWLTDEQFFRFGWRVPFLASAALVLVGLYVRLRIHETPVFREVMNRRRPVKMPIATVLRDHPGALVRGILMSLSTFVLFYLMTVFLLSWGTAKAPAGGGYTRQQFLLMQLFGILFFALTIPVSAVLADRNGRRQTLIWTTVAIGLFGFALAPWLQSGTLGAMLTLALGLSLMGFTYGPLGTALSELFPTRVRYTGSSLTFNLAGIFGASLAPYAATWLAKNYGLPYVGYYLTGSAVLTLVGLLASRETKDDSLQSG
jgi:metabolite-proton symporter